MDNKHHAEEVNIKIGNEWSEQRKDFRADPGAQRIAADALMKVLPAEFKQKIYGITKARGMCRKTQRATGALVRKGIRADKRNASKLKKRVEFKEDDERAMYQRIEKRVARGVDKPLPGMTTERYEGIKKAYGRVEFVKINGEEHEGMRDALVRVGRTDEDTV